MYCKLTQLLRPASSKSVKSLSLSLKLDAAIETERANVPGQSLSGRRSLSSLKKSNLFRLSTDWVRHSYVMESNLLFYLVHLF